MGVAKELEISLINKYFASTEINKIQNFHRYIQYKKALDYR